MGQKTHPTGFRIGINKEHNSKWFANYGAYSKVLEEDYNIRKFFEKEFSTIYNKAGVSKLEINRKVNQLELLIYAARPKAITLDSGNGSTMTQLKEKLKIQDTKFIVRQNCLKLGYNIVFINKIRKS